MPYLVPAGENLLGPGRAGAPRLSSPEVLERGLDAIFGKQNDVAVGPSNVRDLRDGAYLELEVAVVLRNHFYDYAVSKGEYAIARWVDAAGNTEAAG